MHDTLVYNFWNSVYWNGPWPLPFHSEWNENGSSVSIQFLIISMKVCICIHQKSEDRSRTDIVAFRDDRLFSGHWLVRYTNGRALRVRIVRRFVREEHIPRRSSHTNSLNGSCELLPRLCARAYNETIQVHWTGCILHVTSWTEWLLPWMNRAQPWSDERLTIYVFCMTSQLGW
jgi:hypothetical protein